MSPTEIAITGLGMVTSIGHGREAFWESLRTGRSGIIDLRSLDAADYPDLLVGQPLDSSSTLTRRDSLRLGAPVVNFDAKDFVRPRKSLKVMCREIQTSFAASQLAIGDAGLIGLSELDEPSRPVGLTPDRYGTVFGSEMLYGLPIELADAFAACCVESGDVDRSRFGNAAMQKIMPLWMLKYLPNMPACHFGISIGALGPNNTLTVGDVSGPAALLEACGYLQRGIADMMVVSAAGSRLNVTRSIFTEDQPLAEPGETISMSSRPHARDAAGIVRGEAGGGMIVETVDQVSRRGGKPIAIVAGIASRFVASEAFRRNDRNDRIDATAGRGSARAIELAIVEAMRQAGISAGDLGCVVGHGMGDPVIDAAERDVLCRVLPGIPVTFPVSLLGHCGAASGMLELLTAILAVAHRVVPPVPHAADCAGCLTVSDQLIEFHADYALAICHTSPGSATAVVLRRV